MENSIIKEISEIPFQLRKVRLVVGQAKEYATACRVYGPEYIELTSVEPGTELDIPWWNSSHSEISEKVSDYLYTQR